MPWFKNSKPSRLGLSFPGDGAPRVVEPGEVFEAKAEDIPQSYLDQKPTEQTGSTQFEGPEPVQGSGTSVLESSTDKEAQDSADVHRSGRRR
jgi:hypothetical protein